MHSILPTQATKALAEQLPVDLKPAIPRTRVRSLLCVEDHGVNHTFLYTDPEAQHAAISVHGVSSVKIGRWRRLDDECETRTIDIIGEDGVTVEVSLFRDRAVAS